MDKPTLSLISFLMAILMGCAARYNAPTVPSSQPPRLTNIPPPHKSIQREDSQFKRDATFVGITERYPGNPYIAYFLQSWVDKTSGQAQHQLYVIYVYSHSSWIWWNRANSEAAQPLEFTSIHREVHGCAASTRNCIYSERFGVLIPDTMLKAHQNGLSVKVYSKAGKERSMAITSEQIRQQLKAIKGLQASMKQ